MIILFITESLVYNIIYVCILRSIHQQEYNFITYPRVSSYKHLTDQNANIYWRRDVILRFLPVRSVYVEANINHFGIVSTVSILSFLSSTTLSPILILIQLTSSVALGISVGIVFIPTPCYVPFHFPRRSYGEVGQKIDERPYKDRTVDHRRSYVFNLVYHCWKSKRLF